MTIEDLRKLTHKHSHSKKKKVISKCMYRDRRNYKVIKEFFKYTCQCCKYRLKSTSGKYIIQIAHIIPHSETRDNRLENLLVLCSRCHQEFDYSDKRNRILSRIRRNFPEVKYNEIETI